MSHLATLGLHFDATVDDIKAAYRTLVKTCHPDLFPGDPLAHARFVAITDAYNALLRDRETPGVRELHAQGKPVGPAKQRFHRDVELEIWQLTNGAMITLEEAVDQCSSCQGSGVAQSDHLIDCSWCMGRGFSFAQKGLIRLKVQCVPCSGHGKTKWYPCDKCGGSGLVGAGNGLIEIPPHTLPETEIVFPDRVRDPRDDSLSDLIVKVKLKGSSYRVEGLDIETSLRLHLADIVIGGKYRIQNPNGKYMELHLRPGTMPGKVLTLPGFGFVLDNMKGDFRVVIEARPLDLNNPEILAALQSLKTAVRN